MTSDVIKKSFKTFALNLLTAGSENNMVYVLKTISPASPEKKNTCSPPVVHALLKRWKFNYWYKWWRHRHGGASLYVDRLWPRGRWGHSNLLNTEGKQLKRKLLNIQRCLLFPIHLFSTPWKNQLFYWTCIVKSIKGYF